MSLARKALAEFFGSLMLLVTVVGSGIMGVNLSQGNNGVALLANASATAGILYVLISILGPISSAHFNPAVSLIMRIRGELSTSTLLMYVIAQILGAVAGVLLAHVMFEQTLIQPGSHVRSGFAQYVSEALATFGLLVTILIATKQKSAKVPSLVASYIFAAYWFTSSTSFANPAVTAARALTQSFAGIRPHDVAPFVIAQLIGACAAYFFCRLLFFSGSGASADAAK
jgi:glycerol uptake facilitator-like aquaporin